VPTAQVLYVGDDAVPYPYMVQTWVRGQVATHHPARLKILEQLGRHGAHINSIDTVGFGSPCVDEPGTPQGCATWAEFLHGELGLEKRLRALIEYKMIDLERAQRLREVLETAASGVTHGQLVHGDLRLKNVLVDDHGKITAIIDWENSLSSLAPQWEWSIALHDLSIDEMQAFLTGYGASAEHIEAAALAVKALNIVNYVPEIERLVESNAAEQLDWIRIRMSGALDMYSL
jgi:hygromycin-B 4-O-kinase